MLHDRFTPLTIKGVWYVINGNDMLRNRFEKIVLGSGVRFGPADIYSVTEVFSEIVDAICVGQQRPTDNDEPWKIGPAVATGNTVVIKSAEQTPLSALYAAKLVKEAGFPQGVINVISGFGRVAGAAISAHMDVDKVAFTGSTLVGRLIMQAAAKSNLKKVTLELGGKSPNIVFADANIDNAISWVNFGIYYNHGQACCAGSRILVQDSIYDKFLEAFKARALKNKVGDPFQPDTFQGPQVSKLQFDRIMGYIDQGKKDGASVITGGARHGEQGYYIQPTIFSDVTESMSIVNEEIFGPACTVQKFKDEKDAVRLANASSYDTFIAPISNVLN